jgi:hypothetical protein
MATTSCIWWENNFISGGLLRPNEAETWFRVFESFS